MPTLTFPQKTVDPQNYYFFTKGFSEDELSKISKAVESIPFVEGTTGQNLKTPEIRTSSIKWIPKQGELSWVYDKLMAMISEANNAIWNFNIYSALEDIQYTEYYASNEGHYDWHQDFSSTAHGSKRKISVTVQLSDPDDYEGGDLEYWKGAKDITKCQREKGLVFIFPSYMMHRVTKVTKGTRKSFVLWVGGEHYR